MSSHFNTKSLTFYAIAIGSVLLLFNVVTAYGESNLKAPKTIGGKYHGFDKYLAWLPPSSASNAPTRSVWYVYKCRHLKKRSAKLNVRRRKTNVDGVI